MTMQLPDVQAYLERFGFIESPQLDQWGFGRHKAFAAPNDTRRGLIHFQRHFGLPMTGIVDDATLGLMKKPRCGFPDVGSFVLTGNKWDASTLTWRLGQTTPDLPLTAARGAIAQAFKLWRDQCNLEFSEVGGPADIEIMFASGEHGDGYAFDGASGVLAHAFFPGQGPISGDAHFDDGETWVTAGGGIDLITVAAHEFGHSIGLAHSTTQGALMYPYYGGPMQFLHSDDIAGCQALYGARATAPQPPTQPPTQPPVEPPVEPPTIPPVDPGITLSDEHVKSLVLAGAMIVMGWNIKELDIRDQHRIEQVVGKWTA